MPSSIDYWRDREEAQRQKNITDELAYNREIEKIHSRMIKSIQDRINAFYTRYANSEGLTLAEAKKKVAAFDVEAFSDRAARYVKNKDFSKRANEELRLYNATLKINRLEMLKSEIGLDMVGGFDELEKLFGEKLTKRTLEEFRRQAGILGKSIIKPEKLAHSIVNASFHNATFSDRVWAYQDILKSDLDKLLREALIQGLNPRTLVSNVLPNISSTVQNKRYAAMRLLTTELCRVQIDAQMKSYERNGYDAYRYLAEPTACPHCKALDGKTFKLDKISIGENAPPMHPKCRCSTAAAVDEEEYERWFYKETGQHSAGWERENAEQKGEVKPEKIKISPTNVEKKEYKWLSDSEFKTMEGEATKEEKDIIYSKWKNGKLIYASYVQSLEAGRINKILRRDAHLDPTQNQIVDNLRNVISKNIIKDDIIVYRYIGERAFSDMTGIPLSQIEGKLPAEWLEDGVKKLNDKYKEKAFLSTSAVKGKNVFENRREVKVEITVPKGTHGYVTSNTAESEVIFDRPEIMVNEVEYDKSTKKMIVRCELRG